MHNLILCLFVVTLYFTDNLGIEFVIKQFNV